MCRSGEGGRCGGVCRAGGGGVSCAGTETVNASRTKRIPGKENRKGKKENSNRRGTV